MFDLRSGEIEIGSELIKAGYNRDSFLRSNLFTNITKSEESRYFKYALGLQNIENKIFNVSIYFNPKGVLEFVFLSLLIDQDEHQSWESWSEEIEIKRKEINDVWLREKLGVPPYRYKWGEIVSLFDPRSGSSNITIRYFI